MGEQALTVVFMLHPVENSVTSSKLLGKKDAGR